MQQNKQNDENNLRKDNSVSIWGNSGAIRKEQKMSTEQGNHLKHNSVSGGGAQRDRGTTNDNVKINPNGQQLNAATCQDDFRISRILRRLTVENDPNIALELCTKLEMAVRSPTNATYVCRSYDLLLNDMMTVLRQAPPECIDMASKILGLMFYINRSEFGKHTKHFLVKTYNNAVRTVQKHLINALKTMINYDSTMLDLRPYAEGLLVVLKDFLENAAATENFIIITETIVEFSKYYRAEFKLHFTDIVDIIVGWHLEIEQSRSLKQHCSAILQQFHKYFVCELDFTFGLLGQFVEDISSFGDEVINDANRIVENQKRDLQFGSFVGAFNTILKALSSSKGNIAFTNNMPVIQQAFFVITQTAKKTMLLNVCSDETILNLNDFLCLNAGNSIHLSDQMIYIEEIIVLQVENMHTFNEAQKTSLMYLVLFLVKQLRTRLPCTLVTVLFNNDKNNPYTQIKMTNNARLYKLLLRSYQEVLLIKNVPLLQEAYKHIYQSMNDSMTILKQENDNELAYTSTPIVAATNFNFNLAALSVLATQTSSIISMYALSPSILELLINNCQASNVKLWRRHPTLHNALLQLLAVHCQNNRNFIPTSELLAECGFDAISATRTSGNFTTILTFFMSIFEHIEEIPSANLSILLRWLVSLLEESKEHGHILRHVNQFAGIYRTFGTMAIATKCPLQTAECMKILLTYNVSMDKDVINSFSEIAFIMTDHFRLKIRNEYMSILTQLPLTVKRNTHLQGVNVDLELCAWYQSTSQHAPLYNKYFRPILGALEPTIGEPKSSMQAIDELFRTYFTNCWTLLAKERADDFKRSALSSKRLLTFWIQYEAAQYCVRNKLRTSMGKPQDTFLAIEALIMKYSRHLTAVKAGDLPLHLSLTDCLRLQERSRVLLGFLEQLEKLILNAAEGSAFAIQPAEKPAKAFFRINANTCTEWFKRINSGVCLIALCNMEPEIMIRYAENTLRTENPSSIRFEHAVIWMVRGLLSCGESDALRGLHVWLRAKTDKKYAWIQHAAEQANDHKEQAIDGYQNFLTELSEPATGLDNKMLRDFITEQLILCLNETAQWKALLKLQQSSLNSGLIMYTTEHLNLLDCLYYGTWASGSQTNDDRKVNEAIMALTDWSLCEIDASKMNATSSTCASIANTSYSYNNILNRLEVSCINKLLNQKSTLPDGACAINQDLGDVICQGLSESLQHGCLDGRFNRQQIDFLLLNQVYNRLKNNDNEGAENSNTFACGETIQDCSVLLKCLQWTLLFRKYGHHLHTQDSNIHKLYVDVAASARREGNSNLCRSMLQSFFGLKGLCQTPGEDLKVIAGNLQSAIHDSLLHDNENVDLLFRGYNEISQCMYSCGDTETALTVALSLCVQVIMPQNHMHQMHSATCTNILLNIADWIALRGIGVEVHKIPQMQQLLDMLPTLPLLTAAASNTDDLVTKKSFPIPASERIIGKLAYGSVCLNVNSAEAWYAYGNWCYRWGKKLIETKSTLYNDGQKISVGYNDLSASDVCAIGNILGLTAQDERVLEVLRVLERYQFNNRENVEDILEPVDSHANESIESQLHKLPVFDKNYPDNSLDQVAAILKIWRQAQRNAYAHTYYETATRAYFKYLSIAAPSSASSILSKKQLPTLNESSDNRNLSDSTFVTTTLRILRLIVKHAVILQDVLEEGLQQTPLLPWRSIVPQLFSRLNHHESYVRKSVSELLCRLACNQPHLVVFPAVVGAQQEDNKAQESATNTPMKTIRNTSLSTAFGMLLAMLSEQSPEAVLHVKLLVKELRRVTLLWEEYWTHSLSQLYNDYGPLINQLEQESKKGNVSIECLRLAYETVYEHLANDIERLTEHTQKQAETNYERSFHERYNASIQTVIDNFRQQPCNMESPNMPWQRLKHLYAIFQQRTLRGNSAATLKVSDLSSVLATMKSTCIAMPGIDGNETTTPMNTVFIESVENTVYILPTKTRPKKITFLGSDGRRYTYLFKGHEDLHLDERIMQFLSIANSMMTRPALDQQHQFLATNRFRALHYSVIPLGAQSGLISWVDGVTPLFGIYKKWQQRDVQLKQQLRDKSNSNRQSCNETNGSAILTSLPTAPTRPSELFYAKLTPFLAEHDMKVTEPRKQWPLSALRKVLEELTKETPRDLLAKELWLQAANAAAWRQSVRSYAISMAVMSVIGYVIGLGDRHLDNVLIKLTTGEILHIDYNICFEKGKTLRVPEKVPFRMTPNFEEALGITGVEGIFRLGCEHVLRTLRKERETLLTLLEAFVYDPLVDWTVNEEDSNNTSVTASTSRLTSAHLAAASLTTFFNTNRSGGQTSQRGLEEKGIRKQEHLAAILERISSLISSITQGRNSQSLNSGDLTRILGPIFGKNSNIPQSSKKNLDCSN